MRETIMVAGALALCGTTLEARQGPTVGPKVRIAVIGVMETTWDDGVVQRAFKAGGNSPSVYLERFRPGEKPVDPETGVSLGVIGNKLGRTRVVSLQEKVLVAQPLEGVTAQRGDIVRFVGRM